MQDLLLVLEVVHVHSCPSDRYTRAAVLEGPVGVHPQVQEAYPQQALAGEVQVEDNTRSWALAGLDMHMLDTRGMPQLGLLPAEGVVVQEVEVVVPCYGRLWCCGFVGVVGHDWDVYDGARLGVHEKAVAAIALSEDEALVVPMRRDAHNAWGVDAGAVANMVHCQQGEDWYVPQHYVGQDEAVVLVEEAVVCVAFGKGDTAESNMDTL